VVQSVLEITSYTSTGAFAGLAKQIYPNDEKGRASMSTTADNLVAEIRALPDVEKLRPLDAILPTLPNPIRR
jgi:hypothetical protein